MNSAPTPDTAPGPHPDVLLHHDPPRIDSMPEVLQLENLSKIVGIYDKWREQKKDSVTGDVDEGLLQDQIKNTIDQLLEQKGYCTDTDKQTAVQKADLELARDVLLRAMQSNTDDWLGHATGDGHHDGVKNQIFRQLLDRYQFPQVAPDDNPSGLALENELQERIRVHKDELEKAQQLYSKKLAERSKRMGLFERPRTIAEMAGARAEIADYVGKLAAEMMEDFETQGIPYDKRVDMVGAFIDAEMAATVEGMEAIRADDFRGRSKIVQRGLETWASWATPTVEREESESRVHHFGRSVLKSITTLNTWKKAGAFAAVGGLAGVFTVPFVGLVGGGAVIVGGATLLARQIARGLVGAKLDSAAGAETIAKQQADEILFQMAEDSEAADTTHDNLLELAANMAEGYRKHNRNRLIGGIGISLAVGGGVGSLINNFLDLNMALGKLNDVVQNIFGHGSQQSPVIPTTGPSGGAGSGTGSQGGMVGGEIPSDKPDIGGAHSPDANKGEVIKDYLKEHGAARKIDNGEGWLQTFKELGMSPGERRSFLEKYGDDLLKKFPKVTYEMENGEPGILMTKDGKMPPEVLKYIVKHADKEDYIQLSTNIEVPVDSVDTAQPNEATLPHERLGYEVGVDGSAGATTIEAANKLIDTQELLPANTVSNGESLYRTFGELKKAGVIDIPANKFGQLMREVGPAIHNDAAVNKYSDGSSVVYQYRRAPYDWRFYKSPDGRLPANVIRTIERIARQGAYTKAA